MNLPELPDNWIWISLAHIKEFSMYGPRFSSRDYVDEGVAILRTTDVSDSSKVDWGKSPKLLISDDEYEKYKLIKGDLLITRTGSIGTVSVFNLLQKTNLHTILRLPTGIFYKSGLKANVIFFDNKPESEAPQTKEVWYYDFRTNVHFTLRKSSLKYGDLQDFVNCYNSKYRFKHSSAWSSKKSDGRWRKFPYDELVARDKTSLDIF